MASFRPASLERATTMRILVTGSSGLMGRRLVPGLAADGHDVVRLVRGGSPGAGERVWDPLGTELPPRTLEGVDAVIHLAGAGIADKRWSPARKQEIRESRVRGTHLLADAMARIAKPPAAFVCASAIGWYGDRGEEVLREDSAPGQGFLPELCRDWEGAADPARRKGVRVVHLRFGVVLDQAGGALCRMLPPFRLGLAGNLGSGRQWMSWVTLVDAVGAIRHALSRADLVGPVNVVSPAPASNRDFTKALGRVLGRPTLFPMPAFAARLAFGEVADALLLASTRVEPARLAGSGYAFQHPALDGALRAALGR